MGSQRAFAPSAEVPEKAARTDLFWCRPFGYALSMGACTVRQTLERHDGSAGPACAKKAADGLTVCEQGRRVLVALGRVKKADPALAEPLARADLTPRFEPGILPDITRPAPPPPPPVKPPDDYLDKLRFQPPPSTRAIERDIEEDPVPQKLSRQDPRWRAEQAERMKAVREEKLAKVRPLRDAWIAGGRKGPPPEGICDQAGCDSLLRSDSKGTTCSHCRSKPVPAPAPAAPVVPPAVKLPPPVVRPRTPADPPPPAPAPPKPATAPAPALPDVRSLPDEYLAACVGEHARRAALAGLRR